MDCKKVGHVGLPPHDIKQHVPYTSITAHGSSSGHPVPHNSRYAHTQVSFIHFCFYFLFSVWCDSGECDTFKIPANIKNVSEANSLNCSE